MTMPSAWQILFSTAKFGGEKRIFISQNEFFACEILLFINDLFSCQRKKIVEQMA